MGEAKVVTVNGKPVTIDIVTQYKKDLWKRLKGPDGAKLIQELRSAAGKELVCNCDGKLPCHVKVVEAAIAWAVAQAPQEEVKEAPKKKAKAK